MRYTVIAGSLSVDNHDGLEKFIMEVNILTRDGWTPLEGIAASAVSLGRSPYTESTVFFFQSLIKETGEERKEM